MTYAPMQPLDGDVVLLCGHRLSSNYHFWRLPRPANWKFRRPDGSWGQPSWLVCCQECFVASGGDSRRVEFRDDGVWKGDEPFIHKEE
jgi:hypothetical protein